MGGKRASFAFYKYDETLFKPEEVKLIAITTNPVPLQEVKGEWETGDIIPVEVDNRCCVSCEPGWCVGEGTTMDQSPSLICSHNKWNTFCHMSGGSSEPGKEFDAGWCGEGVPEQAGVECPSPKDKDIVVVPEDVVVVP